jgi:hypothetical protein
MKKLYSLIVLGCAMTMTPAIAQTTDNAAPPDISGSYVCQGYDPFKNKDYKAPLIIKKIENTFSFDENFGSDGHFPGIGIFSKDDNKHLAVAFWSAHNPKKIGVQLYTISSDGTLSGNWTYKNEKQLGFEECKKKNNP